MISIVIPARNGAATLAEQLRAIEQQSADADIEVIVADNGSTDDTASIAESFGRRVSVRVVDASARPGPSAARNIGAADARGDLLVFVDADDVVMPGWLAAWAASPHDLTFGTGPVRFFAAGAVPDPADIVGGGRPPTHLGFKAYALGANFGITRPAFDRSGGFPEDWIVAEDVVLSWRLQIAGAALMYLPDAIVAKREASGTKSILRQYYAYGLADPRLYRQFRSAGVPAPDRRAIARAYAGLFARLPRLGTQRGRERWCHQAGRRAGRMVGSWRQRTWYP